MQFSPKDRIVVVMGPTGAGRSTFIDRATRQDGKTVGHSWRSETSTVQSVRATHPTNLHPVVFVDTPGFDDTSTPDAEILAIIVDWLTDTHKKNVNLAAILYFHRISDNRISGTAMKNLRSFSNLCGRKAMPNVVIVTTMWGLVPAEIGTTREETLKQEVWKDMLDSGCGIERFEDTYDSAWKIVGNLVEKDSGAPHLSEKEMDDFMQSLEERKGSDIVPKSLLKQIRKGLSRWFGWNISASQH